MRGGITDTNFKVISVRMNGVRTNKVFSYQAMSICSNKCALGMISHFD